MVSVTTPLPRLFTIGSQLIRQMEADGMVRIGDRQDRHFIDEQGRMFWKNGPEQALLSLCKEAMTQWPQLCGCIGVEVMCSFWLGPSTLSAHR
ncbi:hypothetical protein [Prochlorococcus marinus]|uniref:hypothetical protein n=1 Tax=Prochlorococcus TaxID=1218 RepID=UPI0007B362C0|nr:hypothetical protein [Prochlorococcus marinus]